MTGRLLGVLVTYRREDTLDHVLGALQAQTLPPSRLVVVDNASSDRVRALVEARAADGFALDYVDAGDNLGPAGGIAAGMQRLLDDGAADDDWIMTFDDDDPPRTAADLADMVAFANRCREADPSTAGVGVVGAQYARGSGEVRRIADADLHGAVAVDYFGGGRLPTYRVGAVRTVGVFDPSLFFGFEELDFGLRLRRAGFTLYADGDRWRAQREAAGRGGVHHRLRGAGAGTGEGQSWRRYYGLRNAIVIARRYATRRAALRTSLRAVLGRPLLVLLRSPRRGLALMAIGLRACRDAWTGRLGRTVEPGSNASRPDRRRPTVGTAITGDGP